MKALVLAVLALSGCYFKTRASVVEMPLSAPKVSTTIEATTTADVDAQTQANVLSIRVITKRMCTTQAVQQFETIEGRRPKLAFSPWLIPVMFIPYAIVIVPAVSGLVAVVRASEPKQRYTEPRVISRNTYACPLPAPDVVVLVRFPSGATFEVQTDERGIASVTIPDEEIANGSARIDLDNGGRTVDYDRRDYDRQLLAIEVDE